MALTEGFTTEAFQAVRDQLETNLANGDDIGASVAVHHRGEVVVDIWGGYTDAAKTTPWVRDTIVNVWSTTKTMTFLAGLLLMDRGELDFDDPVAKYWPEFAANGKANVKVRHLLSHSAGLSGWTEPIVPEDLADWEKATSLLAAQSPWWEPGTASGYHAVSQGFLLGEVYRRITGLSFGDLLQKELAGPLGADFLVGVPESEESRISLVIPSPEPDFSALDPDSIMVRTLTSPALNATHPHHRWWRAAEIPAANGHGNARSVALLQSIVANRGEAAGKRFVKPETLDRIFVTEQDGTDLVLNMPIRLGAGYGLGNDTIPIGPRACFWGGFGGSIVVIDQDAELVVAYMMNKMQVGLVGDTRGFAFVLNAAIAASLD